MPDRSLIRILPTWLVSALVLALIVGSAVETVSTAVLGLTLRPVHVVGLLLGLTLAPSWIRHPPRSVRSAAVVTAGLAILSAVPFAIHQDVDRLRLPALIAVNLWLTVIAMEVLIQRPETRHWVEVAVLVVLCIPLIQALAVALNVLAPFADTRVLMFTRVPGTFQEATWLGSFAVAALAYEWQRGRVLPALVAAIVVALSASRSAVLVATGIGLFSFASIKVRQLVFLGLVITFAVFTPLSLAILKPTSDSSSLDSRLLDQRATLATLDTAAWVVGSDELSTYDASRSRQLPATSNNVLVDMVWKQGIFGLAVVVLIFITMLYLLPRSVDLDRPPWERGVSLLAIYGLMLFWFANNSMLRPWFWVLAGAALALESYSHRFESKGA